MKHLETPKKTKKTHQSEKSILGVFFFQKQLHYFFLGTPLIALLVDLSPLPLQLYGRADLSTLDFDVSTCTTSVVNRIAVNQERRALLTFLC